MPIKQLPLKTVDGKEFTWSRVGDGRVGVADLTDLPEHLVTRVYADSADTGFLVRGRKETLLFVFSRHVTEEGDIVESVFTCPQRLGVTIRIIND